MDICEDIKLWVKISSNYNFFHIPKTISLYEPSPENVPFKKKIQALLKIETNSLMQDQFIYNLIFSAIIKSGLKFSIKGSKLVLFICISKNFLNKMLSRNIIRKFCTLHKFIF